MHILKKYPNRRIYDTGNSCYITLADVRRMVMDRQPLQVVDSRTGDDITRSVLLQVIAEMEAEGHQSLLTNRVLEELIRFYGDKLVGLLGPFLERQVVGFLAQPDSLRQHLRGLSSGKMPLPVPSPDQLIDTLTQQYQQLLKPFAGKRRGKSADPGPSVPGDDGRAGAAGANKSGKRGRAGTPSTAPKAVSVKAVKGKAAKGKVAAAGKGRTATADKGEPGMD